MFNPMYSVCTICDCDQMIDISERLVRDDDIVVHENEWIRHIKRGNLNLLVRTEFSVKEELTLSNQLQFA